MADMLYKDNAATLITTIINNVDDPATVSVTAGNGAKFPTIGVNAQNGQPNTFPVVLVRASDDAFEKCLCTARATDTFTLTRAQGGTTKLAFAVGDALYLGNTKEFFDNFLMTQDAQYGKPHWCGTAGGTANDITVVGSPTVTGLSAGLTLEFIANATSTSSAVTFKPNAVTVKNLKDNSGALLTVGDIVSGGVYRVQYNGTEWRVVSGLGSANSALIASKNTFFRNRLVNGSFNVDQINEGAPQNFYNGDPISYGPDQWYVLLTGDDTDGTRFTSGGKNSYRFVSAAPSLTGIAIGQRIESKNSRDLAGQLATLQLKTTLTGLTSVSYAIYYANTNNAFGTRASPTRTLITSGSFTANTTETLYSVTFAVPSGATTGLEVVLSVGALTGGNAWHIRDVQLEKGAYATEFEYREYSSELAACMRYREIGAYVEILPIANSSVIASYYTSVQFKVTKFSTPVVSGTNIQGAFATSTVSSTGMGIGRSDVVANRNNSGTWVASAPIP